MHSVTVYGSTHCQDTQAVLYHLDSLGVQFDFCDVEADQQAAQWLREQTNGQSPLPTLRIGEQVLTNPDEPTLEHVLRQRGAMG